VAITAARKPAVKRPTLIFDPDLGWRRFVFGTIERHLVAGDHYSIFNKPGIDRLAALITQILGRSDPRSA
jgi:hypothetical protein